jgi:hypothetical protein
MAPTDDDEVDDGSDSEDSEQYEDEHEDEDQYEDEDGATEHAPAGLTERARALIRPPTPARSPSTGPASPKRQVDRLDDRERRLCFAASGGAVVIGLIIYLAERSNPHFRLAKGQLTPQTTLVLGIVCGALLLVATLLGRRAPAGFVALFTFLFLGTRYFAGVPFLILAVWLLYRSYKFQKEATAKAKEARAGRAAPSSAGSRGADRAATTPPKKSNAKAPSRSKAPSRPEANKRYTPKRPPVPAPKLSRRERKAAEAAD